MWGVTLLLDLYYLNVIGKKLLSIIQPLPVSAVAHFPKAIFYETIFVTIKTSSWFSLPLLGRNGNSLSKSKRGREGGNDVYRFDTHADFSRKLTASRKLAGTGIWLNPFRSNTSIVEVLMHEDKEDISPPGPL